MALSALFALTEQEKCSNRAVSYASLTLNG